MVYVYCGISKGLAYKDYKAVTCVKVKSKVFPYSLPSVGPGADRGVQAAVAAPKGRSRVVFSLCEAAEGVRSEGARRHRRLDERRRGEGRGAIGAERGKVWGGGIPLPIPLGCLGERRKLPQRPSRNRFWCILPLKSGLWCQQFP